MSTTTFFSCATSTTSCVSSSTTDGCTLATFDPADPRWAGAFDGVEFFDDAHAMERQDPRGNLRVWLSARSWLWEPLRDAVVALRPHVTGSMWVELDIDHHESNDVTVSLCGAFPKYEDVDALGDLLMLPDFDPIMSPSFDGRRANNDAIHVSPRPVPGPKRGSIAALHRFLEEAAQTPVPPDEPDWDPCDIEPLALREDVTVTSFTVPMTLHTDVAEPIAVPNLAEEMMRKGMDQLKQELWDGSLQAAPLIPAWVKGTEK